MSSTDDYTRRQPDEHRLMANMLRVLNGNRALADQIIAEVEDSLWLADHDAQVRAEQAEKDAGIAETVDAENSHDAVVGNGIADAIRAQLTN